MISALFTLLAYLLGSVSFAVVISRLLRLPDPRTYGSGNPGATNVLRSGSKVAAALTLLGDLLKGAVAVWATQALGPRLAVGEGTVALVAVAAFGGHLYPVFFRFKGGKGVATAAGILLALSPWLGLAALAVFAVVIAASRIVSLASVSAAVAAAIVAPLLLGWAPIALAVLLMAALVVWRHRQNLQRLLAGQESRLGARKPVPPPEQA
jgi:glycerol-3-phosphate acyltransferase PlsY